MNAVHGKVRLESIHSRDTRTRSRGHRQRTCPRSVVQPSQTISALYSLLLIPDYSLANIVT